MSEQTRLAVNINDETANLLRKLRAKYGWSATECVRRMAGLAAFAEELANEGRQLTAVRGKMVSTVDWTGTR